MTINRPNLYLCGLLSVLLLFATTASALPVDSDTIMRSGYGRDLLLRGEYEKGILHLREAYLLFPLNVMLRRNLAEGYAAYGHQQFKQKRYEQADENFIKALELYPDEAGYSLLRGICNYNLKKYDVARYELERARSLDQNSTEVLYYLGLVLFETDRRNDALELWEQALKLSPGRKEIVALLAKSRREESVEAKMDRSNSSRFDLTYNSDVDAVFARSVLDVLEEAANLIGAELGLFPESRVPVGIYKRADYNTVTDSPDWSGGFYDGKIRLPYSTLTEITPAMRGVLFHEYAHVVVFELTRGNCPLWLNEGIAEMFGRMQHNRPLPEFGRAARAGKLIDFRKLEANFNEFSPVVAALAYQQSYALVNYMVVTYGWHNIRQILDRLGRGLSFDEAVTTVLKDYNSNYDLMVKEWRTSVDKEMQGKSK